MVQSRKAHRRLRRSFSRIPQVASMPNLIEVQKRSYEFFLQREIEGDRRSESGLQRVFKSVFPIRDFSDKASLEFERYEFEDPKYDVEECQQRGITYAAPLKVTLRLVVWDVDDDSGLRSVRDIKEQDVYMGDMPLMTDNGTFVINGTERVIVSQMHRSPGVFFDHDRGKTHSSGKYLYAARIIPYRGSWLDFEFDAKDLVFVRIDRRRKLPVTVLLRALAMDTEEIFDHFYSKVMHTRTDDGWKAPIEPERLRGVKLLDDLVNAATGKTVVEAGRRVTARVLKKLSDAGMTEQLISADKLIGQYASDDMINTETGEVLIEAGGEIEEKTLESLEECGIDQISVLGIDHINVGAYIRNTIRQDRTTSREEALLEIYKVMRPGEPPTVETAEKLFYDLFFGKARLKDESVEARAEPEASADVLVRLKRAEMGEVWILEQEEDWLRIIVPAADRPDEIEAPVWVPAEAFATLGSERYDLSDVGRVKMGMRLNLDGNDELRVLRRKDIVAVVTTLVALKDGIGEIDDIDHLGNRRVRSVGELMENQYRIGLVRMERAIRERMSSVDMDTVMPHDLINAKPAARRGARVLRLVPAVAVHGPDQPAVGAHAQARLSALGPRRADREAGRLRGARRAPVSLRPHLPDRDAGRTRTSV